jgi:hypothetical protein
VRVEEARAGEEDRAEEGHDGQHQQSRGLGAEGVHDPHPQVRRHEAAEVAHAVDQADRGGEGRAREVGGGDVPEDRLRGAEADRGQAQPDHHQHRVVDQAGDQQADPRDDEQRRGDVAVVAGAVRGAAGEEVRGQAHDPRDREEEADDQSDVAPGDPGDLAGQEEGQPVDGDLDREVHEAEVEDAAVEQGPPPGEPVGLLLLGVLGVEGGLQLGALGLGEPGGLGRAVGEVEEGDHADDHRDQALDHEHPLVSPQAEEAVELHEGARERAADDVRERQAHVEQRGRLRPAAAREPVGEVQDHAREEAGLGDAEEEAEDVEHRRPRGEHEQRGHDAPGHHDPRHPPSRSDLVHDQVRGHLEDRVADEEQAGPEGVGRGREPGVDLEGLLGEADVGAIDERDDVHQQQERQQSLQRLARRGLGGRGVRLVAPGDGRPPGNAVRGHCFSF